MFQKLWQFLKHMFFEKEKTEAIPSEGTPTKGKLGLIHWILLFACIGLAAMILHNYFSIQSEVLTPMSPPPDTQAELDAPAEAAFGSSESSPETMQEYEEFYEQRLIDILSSIAGVGEVSIFVNLDSTEEVIFDKNIRTQATTTNEQDREGGSRNNQDQLRDEQTVTIRGDQGEAPIVIMRKKPEVRGVVVVATGADNIQVKTWIAEAIQRVLDVPLHKISVLPKKS
ncbi:stage III sporulation protein AG [Bacillus horti]|uniref:Stage III sporulation protein AG n=1 Tax=Caldalkalibacillus horti TaxID=77523 RepID=A0ABT9W0T1_9BACI|nr:stage III sporulation protein AG [Bacillus horti]MDQ0166881.1 stage III sporulation protein AG [Bacillus horti]